MDIEFYNVKKRTKVQIAQSDIKPVSYESTTKAGKQLIRYSLKAVDEDGTKLTKFCSKEVYDDVSNSNRGCCD